MIIVVCPGQGSQTPGFLEPWLALPGAASLLASLSEASGIDLVTHGTVSDADTIRDTQIAQPLIVAAGIVTLDALAETDHLANVGGIAGHSVGEFTAATGSGVLDPHDAIRLVGIRGRAMAQAASAASTGMSAVIGGDEQSIESALSTLGLFAANYNGGGQLVVAGEQAPLAALAEQPPAGSRVVPLQVAGAFHTPFMASAVDTLREASETVNAQDPRIALWTNRDGSLVTRGKSFIELMVGQVSSPVRWDKCMESFAGIGVTGIVEVAPGGTLTGLAKRALKGVPTVAVKTPDDIQAARELIDSLASA